MWMLKLAAAAGITMTGGMLGLRQAQLLSLRRQALQDALLLVRRVHARLETGTGDWLAAIAAAAEEGGFQVLQFPRELLRNAALDESTADFLRNADREGLLGNARQPLHEALVCALTRTETLSKMEYYSAQLKELLEKVRQREERDKKLYTQLGWMGGVLLAVILW